MSNLNKYIKDCRKKGFSDEQIKKALLGVGWKESDIDSFMTGKDKSIKKGIPKFVSIILAGIIVVGILIGAYAFLDKKIPENIYAMAMEELFSIKSFHYELDLEISGKELFGKGFNVSHFLAGIVALVDESQEQNKILIFLQGDRDTENNKSYLSFSADVPNFGKAEGEAIIIDNSNYIKISKLPDMAISWLDSSFVDQWLEITEEQMEYFGMTDINVGGLEIEPKVEDLEKLKNLLKEVKIVDVDKIVKTKYIKGVKTSKYDFKLNKEEFKKFISELTNIVIDSSQEEPMVLMSDGIIGQAINQVLENLEISGSIWVGKRDKKTYKMVINFEYLNEIKVKGGLVFFDINEPVDIEKPDQIISIEGSLEETVFKTNRDKLRFGYLRQAALALEMYYDDNGHYPSVNGCSSANWNVLRGLITPGYLTDFPDDPINSGNYVFMYAGNGSNFVLRALIEEIDKYSFSGGTILGCDCSAPAYCLKEDSSSTISYKVPEPSDFKQRDIKRIADMRQVALALERYYDRNNGYISASGCSSVNWTKITSVLENNGYMTTVPDDPINSGNYVYMYSVDSNTEMQEYTLRAVLEDFSNSNLSIDDDGIKNGCDCNDPSYCISP